MALVKASSILFPNLPALKNLRTNSRVLSHALSITTSCSNNSNNIESRVTNKVVFISQSTDVFSNLALEAWLYNHWKFDNKRLLLLYRNSPCVVIGRHQNAFMEANLHYLESAKVPVVRRHSGGGTVYHDIGNLNCSFFTDRKSYNRRYNLDLICRILQTQFGLPVTVNSRDDIMLAEKFKVSGSAAKLGRCTSYHHCTLLVDTDRLQLSLALKGDKDIKTTATSSVPCAVGNLSDGGQKGVLTVEKMMDSLAWGFLDAPLPGEEEYSRRASSGVTLVNPQDDWFPGLGDLRAELLSWDWLYGKNPRFSKTLELPVPEYLTSCRSRVLVTVKCQRGVIEEIVVEGLQDIHEDVQKELKNFYEHDLLNLVRDTPYCSELSSVLTNLVHTWRAPDNAGQPLQL
ncbi:hypothetical protein HAZT_HAZT009354 [Hyalella azteca]|uniref:Lipoyltransferase 1, mitochondrial-like n=1 Tax=Hyalella azteca TaxID=294128 RepID=A0A6A0H844_HYAAZ|nr:lipoyltransferase 1, mitochondrial-like [Hyalella azteca]XP_047736074.1 lipoyltransferase 1, mitochondrial-like [Hyalella azteca]KAA0201916.1 hypothetical protein HAZT_HAZT009354 [Hyalella azteca]